MTPIIDAHHHIWLKKDLAWLNGPMEPRIFGPYESIMRDYDIHEYIDDIRDHGITKSVYVQANWPADKAVEEVQWVQSCAQATGWPNAIVAYADLMSDTLKTTLDAQEQASPLMRGVRMQLHWHEIPHYRFASRADLINDKKLQANLAKIQDYGWLFELQVFSGQMKNAAKLVRQFPDINFVLIHAGMPEDTTEPVFSAWQEGMRYLADQANCYVKLSGLGTFNHCVSGNQIAQTADACLELFGEDRCMFGSNFPIEKIWSDFSGLMDAYLAYAATLPATTQRKVFHDNAARVYKI